MQPNVVPLPRVAPRDVGERTDDELMLLASAGKRDAFELLVRRHAARVRRLALRATGTKEAGDELAQEVWLSVWSHRTAYRPEGTFTRWLVTLTLNRGRNAKRDVARQRGVVRNANDSGEIARIADTSPEEIDRLVAKERARRVRHSLDGIREPLREALVLRFTEELPYEEIAAILDVNESTARSRVFHGLKELRRRLQGVDP